MLDGFTQRKLTPKSLGNYSRVGEGPKEKQARREIAHWVAAPKNSLRGNTNASQSESTTITGRFQERRSEKSIESVPQFFLYSSQDGKKLRAAEP